MAGFSRIALSVLSALVVAGSATPALAGPFGCGYGWSTSSYYYYAPYYSYYSYAVPSYSIPQYYCSPAATVVPVDSPRGNYANPIPAPPTPAKQPPTEKMPAAGAMKTPESSENRAPMVITIRSRAGGYVPETSPSQKDLYRVGFWNLSGREVTLTIADKSWKLPKDQSITLDLERSFAWQIDQRSQIAERIPDGQSSHELVIRD